MKENVKLGVVLLAAGRSERFGANKLLADFGGKPMVCRAMEAMGSLPAARMAVVTGCDEITELAKTRNIEVIFNGEPQLGQAHSIVLAATAMADMDALLVMAADQPLLSEQSLLRLTGAFVGSSKGIACLKDASHMGNPTVFAKAYFHELCALRGDRGAKSVLRAHEEDLCVVSCVRDDELLDADTPQALDVLRRLHRQRTSDVMPVP